MKKKINTIWNSDIGPIENWEDEDGNQMSYEDANELNEIYLNDERANLDIETNQMIICIGDIGLWNGRRSGYKLLGNNVKNILQPHMDCTSENHWYDDGKDICHDEAHHDGTCYYKYRLLKGATREEQEYNAEKLFSKPLTSQRVGKFTTSLRPLVSNVYGWN